MANGAVGVPQFENPMDINSILKAKRANLIATSYVATVLAFGAPFARANLLVNGNFNNGNLTGWWTYAADPANQSAAIVTNYTIDSSANAALTSASSTWRLAIGQNLTIGAGVVYNLSFNYSATDTPSWGSAAVAVNYYDSSATYLGYEWIPLYDQVAAPNTNGQWLAFGGTYTTPANTASLALEFDVWNWTMLHLDNVSLRPNIDSLSASNAGPQILLRWSGMPTIHLQQTSNLVNARWNDVAGTLGSSSAIVTNSESQQFFRLSSNSGLQNSGFEADGAATQTPAGWNTSGDSNADAVVAGGATGGFSLQHSNGTAYVVETSQIVAGLTNGIYKLTAKVKNSGGQKACYLAGNDKITSLPPISTNWADTVVRGITVTNGQCVVRIYSDASASNWCRVDDLQLVGDNIAYEFLKGGDISELPRLEYYGAKFYDNGVQKDCLQILKDHGCNIVRIRMYNDPGNTNYYPANQLDPLGWQNPARTLALCQRAKAMGFKIELTFHYSDYWSNPGTQYKPHDWGGLTFPQLTNALYGFTRDFMAQLTNANIFPEYVSLGNEIRGGILFPDGANSSANGWDNLATLLKTGYSAVKSVSPSSKVVIHLDKVDAGNVNWFFSNLTSRNVNFDVIGCSYYPFWTGLTSSQARAAIESWYSNFNKPVIIMETGYNWNPTTCDGSSGQLSDNGPEPYSSTPSGQKNFLLQCFNDLKLVADGHCIGDLYWDPVFICVPGQGWQNGAPNVVGNTTLFDFSGSALPSLDAFQFNN